jgi:hypothetical protein
MSIENNLPNSIVVGPSKAPELQPAAVALTLGQRIAVIKDARIVSGTQFGGTEVAILAFEKNSNTKFCMMVRSAAGKCEYVYLGNDKEQARSVAQALMQNGNVSKAEAANGNSFVLGAYGKSATTDAMAEEMKARVEAMLAEAWRTHGELMAQWVESVSENTPSDRRAEEVRKDELLKAKMKVATESITARVQQCCDGLISKSQAMAGLPEFLANRVASLIDSTIAAKSETAKKSFVNGVSAENDRFELLLGAMNGVVDPSNMKKEAATS